MTPANDDSGRDARLAEIIEQYLSQRRLGHVLEVSELAQRYPDLAEDISSCLASLDFLEESVSRSQGDGPPPPLSGDHSGPGPTASSDDAETPWPMLRDFHIQREIGRGGMGIVYKACQCSLDRPVALKVLPWATLLDSKDRQRFRNEALAAARLHHTHIVPVFCVGSEQGVDYYAMQYIEGQSLAAIIRGLAEAQRQGGVLFGPRAAAAAGRGFADQTAYIHSIARWGVQAAEALHYAHEHGIVHRDVKPSNLLVDVQGNLRMTDFGVARLRPDSSLTDTGDLVGTLRYMSPEQASGKVVDARADVYSLGLTLCEALLLEPVFKGDDPYELMRRMATESMPRLRRANPAIPRDLETILCKATSRNPADRFASAQSVADDLRRFLDDQPILARGPSLVQTLSKWSSRHRRLLAAALVLLIVAVVGLAASAMLIEKQREEAVRQRDVAQWERKRSDRNTRLAEDAARRERRAAQEAALQRRAARELLARSQADNAARRLEAGDSSGLAELVAAHATAEESPELARSIADLWTRWHAVHSGRMVQLLGHGVPLSALAFSPNGAWLATADVQGAVRLWNAETGVPRSAPFGHSGAVTAIAFDTTSSLLAVGTSEGVVQLWEVETASPAAPLRSHEPGVVTSLTFSPDGARLAVACQGSKVVRLVSPRGRQLAVDRLEHTGPVSACAFSPDGKRVLTAVRNTMHVWDAETGQPSFKHISHPHTIVQLAVSPDGEFAATTTPGSIVRCWNIASGALAAAPLKHEKLVDLVAFSPDGSRLVTATKDGRLHSWDTKTWESSEVLLECSGRVRSMDFSSDGQMLAASSDDGSTRLIDLRHATPVGPPLWHQRPVRCVRFRPTTHWFATASQDGTARIWRTDWPVGSWRWRHPWAVSSLAFDPRGARLAVGGGQGDVAIWDATRRLLLRSFAGHSERVTAVAFSPDGALLATSSEDCTAQLWSVETGQALGDPLRHAEGVKALAFSPDGKLLATAGNEGMLKLWSVGPSPVSTELVRGGSGKGVKAVAFSPDGLSLSFSTNDRRTEIWDVGARRPRGAAIEHVERIRCLVFSPDGHWLLACSEDGTAQPWTVADHSPVNRLMRHAAEIRDAAVVPGTDWFITASEDRTVRIWDLHSDLACDGVPLVGGDAAAAVAVSHATHWLAIGWADTSVWLWPLPHPPRDHSDMNVRTIVALGARTGNDGKLIAVDWPTWRQQRESLNSDAAGQGTR